MSSARQRLCGIGVFMVVKRPLVEVGSTAFEKSYNQSDIRVCRLGNPDILMGATRISLSGGNPDILVRGQPGYPYCRISLVVTLAAVLVTSLAKPDQLRASATQFFVPTNELDAEVYLYFRKPAGSSTLASQCVLERRIGKTFL